MKLTTEIKTLLTILLIVTITLSCKADEKLQKDSKIDNITNSINQKTEKEPTKKNRYSLAYMWHEDYFQIKKLKIKEESWLIVKMILVHIDGLKILMVV